LNQQRTLAGKRQFNNYGLCYARPGGVNNSRKTNVT
jgi:hypothetical protein